MTNRLFYILLFPLLMVWLTPAFAAKRIDLYSDKQLVLDQSVSLRQQAAAKGLETVFVRVSGNEKVLAHPAVKQALAKANDFLIQYSYASTDQVITIAGERREARDLQLQYSPSAVQKVLQDAGLAIWPETRPEVLVWVVSNQQGSRQLASAESLPNQAIKLAGVQSGLPMVMPALDLSDRQRLSPSRLWLLDERAIANASARYGADVVLAGRLIPTSNNTWSARFLLQHGSKNLIFNETGIGAQATAQQLVRRVAAYLASFQAIVVNTQADAPSLMVSVSNINQFEQYAELMNYLNELEVVVSVIVVGIKNDQVLLEIAYNGTSNTLLTRLADAPEIQRLADPVLPVSLPPESVPTASVDSTTPLSQPSSGHQLSPKAAFAWRTLDNQ